LPLHRSGHQLGKGGKSVQERLNHPNRRSLPKRDHQSNQPNRSHRFPLPGSQKEEMPKGKLTRGLHPFAVADQPNPRPGRRILLAPPNRLVKPIVLLRPDPVRLPEQGKPRQLE